MLTKFLPQSTLLIRGMDTLYFQSRRRYTILCWAAGVIDTLIVIGLIAVVRMAYLAVAG